MRASVRVKPGASRAKVGGRYGENELIVAVMAPAVDGRATAAALRAVAQALAVRPSDVILISGATSRTKLVEIPDACASHWATLLDAAY